MQIRRSFRLSSGVVGLNLWGFRIIGCLLRNWGTPTGFGGKAQLISVACGSGFWGLRALRALGFTRFRMRLSAGFGAFSVQGLGAFKGSSTLTQSPQDPEP